MRYCYTPTRLAKNGKTGRTEYWGGCGTNHSSQTSHRWWQYKMVQPLERTGVAVSYKSKHVPPFWPNSPIQNYLPRINENMCLHKDLYIIVHSCFIYNSQNLETTQMSISRWMDTLQRIHTCELHSARKRSGFLIHASACMNIKNFMLSEKSLPRKVHTKWFHFMQF